MPTNGTKNGIAATAGAPLTGQIAYQQMGQEKVAHKTVKADPLREYVAGGYSTWTYSPDWLRSLPFYIDDLTAEFGDDLYERMLLDQKVASAISSLKLSALSEGVTLLPALGEKDAGYEKAVEIRDFCQRALDGLAARQEGGESIEGVLMEMLDALSFGNRVAELVYDAPRRGPLAGKLTLARIKPKPRRSVAFVVDPMNNVRGLLGVIPGVLSPLLVDTTLIDPDPSPNGGLPNLLPRRKFAVLTYQNAEGTSGDPRGRSLLRPAYNPWWLKQQAVPEYLKYLAVFAVPSVIGTTAPEAGEETQYDPLTGEPVYNNDGTIRTLTPEQAMVNALTQFRGANAAAFPNGATVTVLQAKDGQSPFESFFDARNREISDAITGQTLASMEGQHNARAASEVHQDEKGLRVSWARKCASWMLYRDVLRELVRLNFGDDAAADLTPMASLSGAQPEDWTEVAGAVGDLWQKGYLLPSQRSQTDQRLGLPAPTPEEMDAQNAQKLAPPPPPPGSAPAGGDEKAPSSGSDDDTGARAADFAHVTADLIAHAAGLTASDPFGALNPPALALFDAPGDKGHWVTINGHAIHIEAGGGKAVGPEEAKAAVKEHLPGSDYNVASQIGKAVKAGKIKNEQDLYHALAIAHGAHALAVEQGKAKPDSPVGNSSALAAATHVTWEQLKANAEDHPDPKVQAKAAQLVEKLDAMISNEAPSGAPGADKPGSDEKSEAEADEPAKADAKAEPGDELADKLKGGGEGEKADAETPEVPIAKTKAAAAEMLANARWENISKGVYKSPPVLIDGYELKKHVFVFDQKAKKGYGVNKPPYGNTTFYPTFPEAVKGAMELHASLKPAPAEGPAAGEEPSTDTDGEKGEKSAAQSSHLDGFTKAGAGKYVIAGPGGSGEVQKLPNGQFHAIASAPGADRPYLSAMYDKPEQATQAVKDHVGSAETPDGWKAQPGGVYSHEASGSTVQPSEKGDGQYVSHTPHEDAPVTHSDAAEAMDHVSFLHKNHLDMEAEKAQKAEDEAAAAQAANEAEEKAATETPEGGHHVTVQGKQLKLKDVAATPEHLDALTTGPDALNVTPAAHAKIKSLIADGTIKTTGDLAQKLAIAHAASAKAGVAAIGGTSVGQVSGYPTVAALKEAAQAGDAHAQALLPHLGDTSITTPAEVAQKAAQAKEEAFKSAGAAELLHKQIGPQAGSNPGGLYETPGGDKHYVKFYKDPAQAHGEVVANALYNALGIAAPQSKTFAAPGGKVGHAAQIVEHTGTLGSAGLTPERAKEALKGFAADALLGNWDAAGLSHDNMVVGKDGKIHRIDNGGALLHRATGKLKDPKTLEDVREWDKFLDPAVNPHYAKLFQAAGHTGAADIAGITGQIDAIAKLKQQHGGSFENFIAAQAPSVPAPLRKKLGALLDKRAERLVAKRDEMVGYKSLVGKRQFAYEPHSLADVETHHAALLSPETTAHEKAAVSYFKGSGYTNLNAVLRHDVTPTSAVKKHLSGLAKFFQRPEHVLGKDRILSRKITLSGSALDKYVKAQPGDVVKDEGYQAHSINSGVWHGNVHFKVHAPSEIKGAVPSLFTTLHKGESEIFLDSGTPYRILKVEAPDSGPQQEADGWMWHHGAHRITVEAVVPGVND